jgi:hypothetical protein
MAAMRRPLVDINNVPMAHLGKNVESQMHIGTVHDYKAQQGSPEEEAGYTDRSTGFDKYHRYPVNFPSLFQLTLREDAPEWLDIGMSGVSEFVTAWLFGTVVNQAIASLRIAAWGGSLLAFPIHGLVVAMAAGFMAFALTALFGHASVRLNPAIILIEAFLPHHWYGKHTEKQFKSNSIGWNVIISVVLIGAQFLGYWAATAGQNFMTNGLAPLDGTTCQDAASPIQDASLSTGKAFFVEFFGSFIISLAWFCSSLESRGSFNAGPMRSWVIGGAHFAATAFAFTLTTALFNPSRYLASAVTLGTFCAVPNGTHWTVEIFAPLVGAAGAAFIFLVVTRKTSLNMAFGSKE